MAVTITRVFARRWLGLAMVFVAVSAGLLWFGRDFAESETKIQNVLLISIDTCRADRISCYGFDGGTTPNIDAVARDGVLFTRAYSTNPTTLPAHCSLFTGTTPLEHGVHANEYYRLADSRVTLAEILQEKGFQTAAFVGAFVLDASFGLDQGFHTYDDELSGGAYRRLKYNERPADQVSARAVDWLDQHGADPFFLFLHYFDPHPPYQPPEPFASRYPEAPYAGEIAFTDHCIGGVIAKLKSLGLYDSTLIIITSDHGEGLGEHQELTHNFFIYLSTIRIPLIIKVPAGATSVRINDPASLIDVVPTVLGLLKVGGTTQFSGANLTRYLDGHPDQDDNGVVGRSLYHESLEPTVYGCCPLRGVTDGKWHYIWSVRPELYDLIRDPAETKNLVDKEPETTRSLHDQLQQLLATQDRTTRNGEMPNSDPMAVQRLKSLGYVGGGWVDDSVDFDPQAEDPKDFVGTYKRINAAMALYQQKRVKEAEAEFLAILASRPRLLPVHFLVGNIALEESQPDVAIARLSRALEIAATMQDPTSDRKIVNLDIYIAKIHNNLGSAFHRKNIFEQAKLHYQLALESNPNYANPHNNLGLLMARQENHADALSHFQRAVRIRPDYAEAHKNLGKLFYAQRNFEQSARHFEHALRFHPGYTEALGGLAWLLATCPDLKLRRPKEAVELAERASGNVQNRNPVLLNTLAAAYAANGQIELAIATVQDALKLATDVGDEALNVKLRKQLELYKQAQADGKVD